MAQEIESINDIANKYNMSVENLEKIIKEHNVPHEFKEDLMHINVKSLDRWLASNIKLLSSDKLESIEKDQDKKNIWIHPMLEESRILINPPDSTKTQILNRLVEALAASGATAKKNVKHILKAVIQRERLCSTAIMDGVAIPHPRSCMGKYIEKPTIVLAVSKRGIHFESDDGKPTNLFFLICANQIDIHLKAMARLSRLLKSPKFRHELIISEEPSKVCEVFKTWEEELHQ